MTIRPLLLSLSLASLSAVARADTIHVPADAPSIGEAILLASPGDVVLVADGTYMGPSNRDMRLPAWDIVIRSENGAKRCKIDVQGTPIVPHRAFVISGHQTRATRIEGFTITGGATLPGAIADAFNGGAILTQGSSPTIADCRFVRNSCGCWGGAVSSSQGGSPLIERCFFEGNHAGDEGGALFAWNQATPVVNNSVFIGNSAGSGGGAISVFSSMEGNHLTVVGNRAGWGGGLVLANSTLRNSIVWKNSGEQIPHWGGTTLSYCLVQGGFAGTGNIDSAPKLRGDGFHLQPGSPCIDAGDPASAPGSLDIDGQLRTGRSRVDIGADETPE